MSQKEQPPSYETVCQIFRMQFLNIMSLSYLFDDIKQDLKVLRVFDESPGGYSFNLISLDENQRPKGFLTLKKCISNKKTVDEVSNIFNVTIYVEKGLRRQGVAKNLLLESEAYLKSFPELNQQGNSLLLVADLLVPESLPLHEGVRDLLKNINYKESALGYFEKELLL